MIFSLRSNSIRRRLIVQLSLVAAILSFAFYLIVRAVAEQAATETQDNILAASATSIADALYSERGMVNLELPYSALSMLGSISQDRVFYRIIVDGETLTGYADLPDPDLPGPDPVFSTFVFRDEEVRSVAITRPVSLGGQAVNTTTIVAQTRLGLAMISSRISATAAAVGFGFFLFAIALSLLAAQSALAPLRRMTQSIQRRGPQDLSPVKAKLPSELVPLVGALNNFMNRLRSSLAQSEDFVAEAAHRVRTPLAIVRTRAEIALRRMEDPEDKKALREMIRAVDESSRSAGQLLDHAMVTFRTDNLLAKKFDLGGLTRDTCEHLSPTAGLKDINLLLEIPEKPCPFVGDPILMQNALRNILDNAIKYSPADSEIIIRLTRGKTTEISFCDQGRGFGTADLGSLTKRFSRGENVADIVGSGLGLTIADVVARAHGGYIQIQSNPKGNGACVSLFLP
ncbi:MAG: sensor histidine kinase [Rhodobacteraceae bacterium]|nr:sensor histidine kinase [Paracoccaceae bacterium]